MAGNGVYDDTVLPRLSSSARFLPLLLRLKLVCSSWLGSVADAESQKMIRDSPGPKFIFGNTQTVGDPLPYWNCQLAMLTLCVLLVLVTSSQSAALPAKSTMPALLAAS